MRCDFWARPRRARPISARRWRRRQRHCHRGSESGVRARARARCRRRQGALFSSALRPSRTAGRKEAAAIWRELLADAPADAPWVGFVREALARVDEQRAVAKRGQARTERGGRRRRGRMSPEQRTDMIRGMVERLAERLQRTAPTSRAGCGWCAPIWCWASATRRALAAADARRALAGDTGQTAPAR